MEIINIGISFVEILSALTIYNILFNKKLIDKILLYTIMAIFTSIMYCTLVGSYYVDQVIALVGGLFLNAIIIGKIEKRDTIVAFIELMVSGLFVLGFELITTFIIHIILGERDAEPITYCALIVMIMFSLIILLAKTLKNRKIKLKGLVSKYKQMNIIVLNLFVYFLFVKVLLANDLVTTSIAVQVTILCLILVGINCYFYIYLYKTLNQKKKTEIQKSFNPLINELMAKVKANEHEYNNHLNAIWGIAQTVDSENIKSEIKKYIGDISGENKEFSRLLHIDNTIIKAVLYNKIQRAEKLGVKYEYSITSDLKEIPTDDSELTVIFSNLLNNAIEATSMIKNKEIEVLISESDKKYYITVKNRVENLKPEVLSNMFKIGYSTKGEGRGYGLYNVKKIVDKYRGKLELELDNDILSISILFSK